MNSIFEFFVGKRKREIKKSCLNCSYYSEYRQPDKINSDKTITRGTLFIQSCRKMDDLLTDTNPCELHSLSYSGTINAPAHAMMTFARKNIKS